MGNTAPAGRSIDLPAGVCTKPKLLPGHFRVRPDAFSCRYLTVGLSLGHVGNADIDELPADGLVAMDGDQIFTRF